MEWKTIDSAPKDGSVVLGYYPCGAITVVYYREYIGYDKQKTGFFSFEKDEHVCCSSVVVWPDSDYPTHWMPLPEQPK